MPICGSIAISAARLAFAGLASSSTIPSINPALKTRSHTALSALRCEGREVRTDRMKIHLHKGDLPNGLDLGPLVAIDTETLGLNPNRDRLCLAQLSAGDGVCHAVQFAADQYGATNLKKLLADAKV